jgi:hypothetical protein
MSSSKQKLLLGLGLAAGVAALVGWQLCYRTWPVARYQRLLAAGGEKLRVEELLPPPVPWESNGAPLFSQSVSYRSQGTNLLDKNAPLAMHLVAPGRAQVGWAQPNVLSEQTNSWSQVEAALAQYEERLDLIREAAERPVFDFRLDYRQGPSLLLPHLAPLKWAVQHLTIATLCDLHDSNAVAATTNLEVMLALVKATGGERLAISQLVRLAMAQISLAATWELLQSPNLSDSQLAAIQRDWTQLQFLQPAEDALAMERALGQMMLERMRHSSAQFRQTLSMGGGSPWGGSPASSSLSFDKILGEIVAKAKEAQWRLCFSYPDQLRALKGYQVLLEAFRHVQSGQNYSVALSWQQARLKALGLESTNEELGLLFDPSGPDLHSLFSQSVVSLSRVLHRVYVMETGRELTITVIALQRYRLRHGQYPTELSALVPEFLAAMPRDPADGAGLRYRSEPEGTFLLYSVGEDGVDDGGDASPATKSESFGWQQGRDLVWPQPATAEQVRIYWEKKAKRRH